MKFDYFKNKLNLHILNVLSLLGLGDLFFRVFSFCPFKMPYIYCAICPVRCTWHDARGFFVLGAIVANLKNDFFCNRICPIGTLQAPLYRLSRINIHPPKLLRHLKYLSVILLVAVITLSFHPQLISKSFLGVKLGEIGITKMKYVFFSIFIGSILLSIFSYRFFCYTICPTKALSRILQLPLRKKKERTRLV